MRRYVCFALLCVSVAAHASATLRVGSHVLSIGDSAARVQELLGPPALRVYLHRQDSLTDKEVSRAEQWQYIQDGQTITVIIRNGRATDFDTQRN